MTIEFQNQLSLIIGISIRNIIPVSGGDISLAYKVKTELKTCFLKVNSGKGALTMFQKEKNGLETIAQTKTISTPKIYACDSFNNDAFLLMEYIESKLPSNNDFKTLGFKLAELHQSTSDNFGLKEDNFIGSLFQSNKQNSSWVDFYIYERLLPQLQLAQKKGLLSEDECPSEIVIKDKLEDLFYNVKPSLLHGDLWSGNYLISKNGIPYLIDPAVYYGHNEVDIAMTKLFGGFGEEFYKSYYTIYSSDTKTASRIEIYQLYYLLVHLNLFGRPYYSSVIQILNKYFK